MTVLWLEKALPTIGEMMEEGKDARASEGGYRRKNDGLSDNPSKPTADQAVSGIPRADPRSATRSCNRAARPIREADIMQCRKLQPFRSLRRRGRAEIDRETCVQGGTAPLGTPC